jgi:hypothetical protein
MVIIQHKRHIRKTSNKDNDPSQERNLSPERRAQVFSGKQADSRNGREKKSDKKNPAQGE